MLSVTETPQPESLVTRPGRHFPLGATVETDGINFALFSENATAVHLCLYDAKNPEQEAARIRLEERTEFIWHVLVEALLPNAKLNDCYELLSGTVVTAYDPNWGNVVDVGGIIGLVDNMNQTCNELQKFLKVYKDTPEHKSKTGRIQGSFRRLRDRAKSEQRHPAYHKNVLCGCAKQDTGRVAMSDFAECEWQSNGPISRQQHVFDNRCSEFAPCHNLSNSI